MQRKRLAFAAVFASLLGLLAVRPAQAQVTISNASTAPIATATANNGQPSDIIITGSIIPTASGAAVTINSNNSVTNEGSVGFTNVNQAVGIAVQGGYTGQVNSTGAINLNETYVPTDTNNDGLLNGPFALGSNRYGIQVTGTSPFNGGIISTGGSNIQGNESAAIDLQAPITGSLLMITVTPSTTAGAAPTVVNGTINITGDNSVGVNIEPGSGVGGDVKIATITSTGVGARGVVVDGTVGGTLNISGNVTVTGYRTTTRQTDPTISELYTPDELQQGGPAVSVGASVAKGVIISAPPFPPTTDETADLDGDGVPDLQQGTGSISSFGSAPALQIGSQSGSMELGIHGTNLPQFEYGLINQGNITGNGLFDPLTSPGLGGVVSATAVQIGGGGETVIVDVGMYNSGTILANSYQANATAIHIGAGATVPAIVNDGTITAQSDQVNTATNGPVPVNVGAILIDAGASVTSITNNNAITASITGTGGVGGAVGAIVDNSGTVTNVTNTGAISGLLNQTVVATPMPGSSIAIDIHNSTAPQTITQQFSQTQLTAPVWNSTSTYSAGQIVSETVQVTNNSNNTVTTQVNLYQAAGAITANTDPSLNPSVWKSFGPGVPSITGDILFGSGGSTFNVTAGTVLSNIIDMGAGNDTLTINGPPGTSVSGAVHLGPAESGVINLNVISGTLSDTNTVPVKAGSINVGATGVLLVGADPIAGTNTRFLASGASTFASGSEVGLTLASIQQARSANYVILQTVGAGTLSAGTFAVPAQGISPFLYIATPSYVPATAGSPGEIVLSVNQRTQAQLGWNNAEEAARDAILTAIPSNAGIQSAVLEQTTQQGLKSTWDQLLPNQGQGIFEALDAAAEAVSSMTSARPDAGTPVAPGASMWLQEVNERVNSTGLETVGSDAKLLGLVGGYEQSGFLGGGGSLGFTLAYYNLQEQDDGAAVGDQVVASLVEAGLYYRQAMGPLTITARGAGGYGWFDGTRVFVAPTVQETASSSWNGYFFDGHLGMAWEHKLVGRYYIRPEISGDYLYLDEGSHNETGGGTGFDLNVASRVSTQGSAQAIMVFGAQYGTTGWLRPEIRAGWRKIFAGQIGDTVANFDGGNPFTLAPDNESGGWATVGFSIKGGSPYSYVALEGDLDFRNGQQRYDLRIAGRSIF